MHHNAIAMWVAIGCALFASLSASGVAIYDDWKRRRAKKA